LNVQDDALQTVKTEIHNVLGYESKADSLPEALLELVLFDLETLDKGYQNDVAITEEMNQKAQSVLEKLDKNNINWQNVYADVEKVYLNYLTSFMVYYIKHDISTWNVKINVHNIIIDYINKNQIKVSNETVSQIRELSQATMNNFSLVLKARTQYAKLRKENATYWSHQIKTLFYSMTRSIDFNMEHYPETKLRMSELALAYFKVLKAKLAENDAQDTIKGIINELQSEGSYCKENETEDNPLSLIYSYSMSALMKISHSVYPEISNEILINAFPGVFSNVLTNGPLFKKLYDTYYSKLWDNWENQEDDNKKAMDSILMVEVFNHVNRARVEFKEQDSNSELVESLIFSEDDINNFIENSGDLLLAPLNVLENNEVYELYFLDFVPVDTNLEFHNYLYSTLLEFRYKNVDSWNEDWSATLDSYLDIKFDNEDDDKYKLYYTYIKMLNILRMLSNPVGLDTISFKKFSDDLIENLKSLENSGLKGFNDKIKRIVSKSTAQKNLSWTEAVEELSELEIKMDDVRALFKVQIERAHTKENTEREFKKPATYEFSTKVYSDKYQGLKKLINKQEENKPNNQKEEPKEEPESDVLDAGINESEESQEQPKDQIQPQVDVLDAGLNESEESQEEPKDQIQPQVDVLDAGLNESEESQEEPAQIQPKVEIDQNNLENIQPVVDQKTSSSSSSESHDISEEDQNNPKLNNKKKNDSSLEDEEIQSSSGEEDQLPLNQDNHGPNVVTNQPVNKIVEENDKPKNLVEVVAGGDLTRQEYDILEDPNVMNNLKDMENNQRKILYENADGSWTEIIFVQVVPYKSPCYDEIKRH
jgi:hypothetical protein